MHRTALVPFPAPLLYRLVNDVAAYPEFLPWCRAARVLESDARRMRASLQLTRAGISSWFTTSNALQPDRSIDIRLESGPFRHLEGRWTFEPLGAEGTKVTLDMSFEFEGTLLNLTFGPLLQDQFGSLLDAFVVRAHAVHGG